MQINKEKFICIIIIYVILIVLIIYFILKKKYIKYIHIKHLKIVNDLRKRNMNYLYLRNIDPTFVIYNTTYKCIPKGWLSTVYNTNKHLVNSWAPYSLDKSTWDVEIEDLPGSDYLPSSYRYTLYCSMVKPTQNGPILFLEDPFDSLTTEPILNISNKESEKFIGKILFIYMEYNPFKKKGIVSFIINTNLPLVLKKEDEFKFNIKAEKVYTNLSIQ